MPQAFAAKAPKGISVSRPQNYRFALEKAAAEDSPSSLSATFRKLNAPDAELLDNAGASIGAIDGATMSANSMIDFVERVSLDAQISSDRILAISSKVKSAVSYPASQLGKSLKFVAQLIGGGCRRVFFTFLRVVMIPTRTSLKRRSAFARGPRRA